MTKVLMTMGLPSDRSHEQSANIEFANSIRCYSDPIMDTKPVAVRHSDPEVACQVHEFQRAFGKLPSWQQEVVLRVGVESEEYGDTATALGIPVVTVRSHLA